MAGPAPRSAQELQERLEATFNAIRAAGTPAISGATLMCEIIAVNGIWPEVVIDLVEGIYGSAAPQDLIELEDQLSQLCEKLDLHFDRK